MNTISEQVEKYIYFENHDESFPFTVIHKENDTETIIAITDTAEKAHFLTKAANSYNAHQKEKVLDISDAMINMVYGGNTKKKKL